MEEPSLNSVLLSPRPQPGLLTISQASQEGAGVNVFPETWITLACWHNLANSARKDECSTTKAIAGALDLANEIGRWGNNVRLVPIGLLSLITKQRQSLASLPQEHCQPTEPSPIIPTPRVREGESARPGVCHPKRLGLGKGPEADIGSKGHGSLLHLLSPSLHDPCPQSAAGPG